MRQEFYDELVQRIILYIVKQHKHGIREKALLKKTEKTLKKLSKMLDIETEL